MDDTAVIERLRSELRAQGEATPTPDRLLEAGRRRWRRRRAQRTGMARATAAGALIGVAGLAGGGRGDDGSVDVGPAAPAESTTPTTTTPTTATTEATTTTAPTSVWDDPPSQSPEDAARDGVIPEIAALPLAVRNAVTATLPVAEGEWAISEPTEGMHDLGADSCLFGDLEGTPHVDSVCTYEYAEVVLLDPEGRIARAYPMGGAIPTWIHVTDDAVYGGRVGDGGLPHSTVFRIDRTTLALRGFIFPAPDSSPGVPGQDGFLGRTAAQWSVAPDTATGPLVTTGADAVGTEVTSTIGPTRVDLPAVEALFA